MKYILLSLLVLLITKPSDTHIKDEVKTNLTPVISEIFYREMMTYHHSQIDEEYIMKIPHMAEIITNTVVDYFKIEDFILFKVLVHGNGAIVAIGILNNTYFLIDIDKYEDTESIPVKEIYSRDPKITI